MNEGGGYVPTHIEYRGHFPLGFFFLFFLFSDSCRFMEKRATKNWERIREKASILALAYRLGVLLFALHFLFCLSQPPRFARLFWLSFSLLVPSTFFFFSCFGFICWAGLALSGHWKACGRGIGMRSVMGFFFPFVSGHEC
ncbi:hypothetical protein BGZ63DRAFT_208675 [Mariannaea sp. PMI_226]|nr:hypothetical protein BGZ63DRAFT_208675 [Mariannaea sp. PMI_226]